MEHFITMVFHRGFGILGFDLDLARLLPCLQERPSVLALKSISSLFSSWRHLQGTCSYVTLQQISVLPGIMGNFSS